MSVLDTFPAADAAEPRASAAIAAAVAPVPAPCLVVNPRSFAASRGLAARAVALARAEGAEVLQVDGMDGLRAGIEQVLARRQRHLMVLAGDGTVHAIVEQLAQCPPGAWLPDLLVLPGGRSNLTANDLTPQGDALGLLARALRRCREASWDDASVTERAVLTISQAGTAPRHGFFVAAALIDSIIRATHEQHAEGPGALQSGTLATVWSLLRLGVAALFGRSTLACPSLAIDAGATGRLHEPVRVLIATTLQHGQGLFDPYAERGAGPLRLTAITRRAAGFWRALPRVLTGRFSERMTATNGYLSGRCERVEITGLHGYALDGEEYDTDPARPVFITAGPRLRFLLP